MAKRECRCPPLADTLVEKLEGKLGMAVGERVVWEDVLALDLVRQEIEALLNEAGR